MTCTSYLRLFMLAPDRPARSWRAFCALISWATRDTDGGGATPRVYGVTAAFRCPARRLPSCGADSPITLHNARRTSGSRASYLDCLHGGRIVIYPVDPWAISPGCVFFRAASCSFCLSEAAPQQRIHAIATPTAPPN